MLDNINQLLSELNQDSVNYYSMNTDGTFYCFTVYNSFSETNIFSYSTKSLTDIESIIIQYGLGQVNNDTNDL